MVPKKKAASYDSSHIETLRYPDSVRANPEMYLGSTEAQGVFKIIGELVDNAVDEAHAGRNTGVMLFVDKDGSYWVQDRGAGIPQGIKEFNVTVNGKQVKSSMPTMQAVFGELHTSGKFRSEAYAVSIGTHGVGAKGTNATCLFFDVVTCFKGKWYSIGFKKGLLTSPVKPCKAPKSPVTGKLMTGGTLIHCKPDPSIFTVSSFPLSMAVEWAELTSYLNPGFTILVSAWVKKANGVKTRKFYSEGGAEDYIAKRLTDLKATAEPDHFTYQGDLADVVVAFSNFDGMDLRGFTNGLHNAQGGHHVDSVSKALFAAISEHKGKRQTFNRRDFDEGLLGIVNAKLHKAAFSSQDKSRLTDTRMTSEFEAVITAAAKKFFAKNKAMAARLCERAAKLNELKTKFKASKEVVTALSKQKKVGMPPNYAPPHRSVPIHDREMFIVEGDSAAGGFRKVRQPQHGLLPLFGKIANVEKMKTAKALATKAIVLIMAAINYDPKAADPLTKVNVGRIVCLADADADGGHINSLLLSLFKKLMPEAYDRGMIYVADMPEYMAQAKGHLIIGDSQQEVKDKLDKLGLKATVKHFKGWGEVDPAILKVLAIDPTRKLLQINPISSEDGVEFSKVMASDVEARREALGISEEQHHE